MSHISRHSKSAAILAMLSLGAASVSSIAWADVPPARNTAQTDPQVKKLMESAAQAMRDGNVALATIQLKNALRLDPNNGALRGQLGIALFRGGDPASAERELRQARVGGAKDQDVVPPLLEIMLAGKENKDLLNDFPDPAPTDKTPLAASILRARALSLQAGGNSADALSSIERSLAIRRDINGLLARVQIVSAQNLSAEALKSVNEALALVPNNPNALMMKAEIVRATDKNAALAIMDSVLKTNPNLAPALMAKVELLIQMGRNDEAQKLDDAVLAKSPNLSTAIFFKAILLGAKSTQDGWRIAQSLPAEFIQSSPTIAIGVAGLAASSGNQESANAIMTRFVAQNPSIVETRLRLAALRMNINDTKGALDILGPLMDSKDPRALELIGSVYAKLNRQTDALTYLRKAVAAGSKNNALPYQIALADLGGGNTAQGVQETLAILKQQPDKLDMAAAAIETLLHWNKYAEAQTIANQAEASNPKRPEPPFFKGEILFSQKKNDEGLVMLNQSLQRDPHYIPALYARAQIFITQDKYPDATKDLKQAQALQPDNPQSYERLAEVAALMRQPTQALALLKQAVAKSPKLVATRLVMAKYQISLKQYADAEATLKDALKLAPNDPQALALLGAAQQALGQNSAAVGTNKMLTQKYQQSGAAQALLANSLQASGDKKGAIAALKRAVQISPDVVQYTTALINLQIEAKDNPGAIATAQTWSTGHKGADGALMLAETLTRLNHLPEAAAVVSTSQAANPDWRLTLLDSQIAASRGDNARAASVLKSWVAGHSTDVPVRVAYAGLLMQQNDNPGALAQYEVILKSRSDIPIVLNNVAWLVKDSNSARAVDLASKAMQLQPNSADIADTFGWILFQKGDAKGAVPVLQKAHANGPAVPEISYHLAAALNATGKKGDAKQLLQATLAKDGNFGDAAAARKLLQTL